MTGVRQLIATAATGVVVGGWTLRTVAHPALVTEQDLLAALQSGTTRRRRPDSAQLQDRVSRSVG